MPKNAYSQSYRKMSELSSPCITLAVLAYTHTFCFPSFATTFLSAFIRRRRRSLAAKFKLRALTGSFISEQLLQLSLFLTMREIYLTFSLALRARYVTVC
jgi:hypothetical protein